MLEYKSIPLDLQDLDKEHGVAVIAHATYDNIDLLNDICREGMFNKSWNENKALIKLLINHDDKQVPGITTDFFENKAHAFTKAKFANTTLGRDTIEMLDMGIIKDASFGFLPIKYNKLQVKGKKIRELKEVYHGETTLVHGMTAINPKSGVVLVKKAQEKYLLELKASIDLMEKFCRETKASDDTIIKILAELKSAKYILSAYDTACTQDVEPDASDDEMNIGDEDSIATMLKLINAKISMS